MGVRPVRGGRQAVEDDERESSTSVISAATGEDERISTGGGALTGAILSSSVGSATSLCTA